MAAKRTDLQKAQDAIRDKIAVLQAALDELRAVEKAKPARRKPETKSATKEAS